MRGFWGVFLRAYGAAAAVLVGLLWPWAYAFAIEVDLDAPYLQTAPKEKFALEMESQALPLAQWLTSLSQDPYNFICLGESHTESHRNLLAKQVFPFLKVDHLLLEATQEQTADLVAQSKRGQSPVNLLGAPIDAVLKAVWTTSPGSAYSGVEITSVQKAHSNLNPHKTLARDGWITSNILKVYNPGDSTVALFGASHCAKNNVDSGWVRPFFSMLREARPEAEKLLSVKVIVAGGRASYPLSTEQALLLYLQNSAHYGKSFVLPNLSAISKRSFNSKVDFLSLFESYDALIFLWLN